MSYYSKAKDFLYTLHWRRGLRAGFAVATAMVVCQLLGKPMGWAALGGFESVLVDNGGPYRSRMNTIVTLLFGGAVCAVLGSLAPESMHPASLLEAVAITTAVCFAVTFARVISQPIASSSAVILVIYFVGFGSDGRTVHAAFSGAFAFILGGLWAATISLFLWPVDPFRPAREEVAECYDLLAAFTARLNAAAPLHSDPSHDHDHSRAVDLKRQLRSKFESARAALSATAARAPARTVRARSLSVLLETADMLFAATVRLTELAEFMPQPASHTDARPNAIGSVTSSQIAIGNIAQWLSRAELAIAGGLHVKPADNAASFAQNGSQRLQFVTRPAALLALKLRLENHPEAADNVHPSVSSHSVSEAPDALQSHLLTARREAIENLEIAFEALRAVWTGTESRHATRPVTRETIFPRPSAPQWWDSLRQNWSLDSILMRHALRVAVVGAMDVLLIRAFHISHGFWLAMTSIIVLQPYGFGALRRSVQRVAGTVAGGVLAAILAASIHSYWGIIVVISVCSVLTLATYAVDYGWFSFFITPTFVLLTLPYLRDWRFAEVRILDTLLGAVVAVLAMRVLWPQSLSLELARLLGRSTAAPAAYLNSVLTFWSAPEEDKKIAERKLLAPARRNCGLTSQDAEEALDRILLEPDLGRITALQSQLQTESALTYTTYIRRLTQCITTLASLGTPDAGTIVRLRSLIDRLDTLRAVLTRETPSSVLSEQQRCKTAPVESSRTEPSLASAAFDPAVIAEQMLQRMERQAHVLERAAEALASS
jgi:uncharacterized membrane protein YccC